MALMSDKSLFLHNAKTGGMWVRHIYKVNHIPHEEIGQEHSHFPALFNFRSKEEFQKRFIYTFIRHPLSWYQSRWAFRLKYGWKADHPLDYNCASNNFLRFVENCLEYKPTGWVTYEYKNYIDNVPWGINYVGKIENIVEDSITIMKMAGERVSIPVIRSMLRTNDSDLDGKPSEYWAKYTPKLVERVLQAESEIIERYYKNYKISPNILYKS